MGGNRKIVRVLLDHGADPNVTDLDVLEQAVKRGRLDIVRMLIQAGAGQVIEATAEGPRNAQSLMKHALASENEQLCRYLSPLWDYA
jgi:ankyrin repeat protein